LLRAMRFQSERVAVWLLATRLRNGHIYIYDIRLMNATGDRKSRIPYH
jgi:hypothetical protein